MNSAVATPHARGSTDSGRQSRVYSAGYPACAGIDHKSDWSPSRPKRLPRMRGDRPLSAWHKAQGDSATPHARGSTFCRDLPALGG